MLIGSYGWRRPFGKKDKAAADGLAVEIGRAFIENDIELIFGGAFELGARITAAAEASCSRLGKPLRQYLTTYYAPDYPAAAGAQKGQLFRLRDDETYWTRVLMDVDAVVGISGRDNTKTVLDLARALRKPSFPIGLFEGAAQDMWEVVAAPQERWLGDLTLSSPSYADQLAANIRQLHAPGWTVGLVFMVMHFTGELEIYNAVADECAKLIPPLTVKRADSRPGSLVIIDEIKRFIEQSEFIIVDLSNERPNVYYELGYAHGVGNQPSDILLIAHADANVHFNISGLQVHRYHDIVSLRGIIQREFALMVENRRQME